MPEGCVRAQMLFGGIRRVRAAGSGGQHILKRGVAAGEELRDQFAGEDEHGAVGEGDEDLAVERGDLGALEVEGKAQDHVGGEVDLDPFARRRFGNEERLALLRERRDLASGLDELEPERVARGLRSRMAALRGLYCMLGTNGSSSLYPGLRGLLPTTVKSKKCCKA